MIEPTPYSLQLVWDGKQPGMAFLADNDPKMRADFMLSLEKDKQYRVFIDRQEPEGVPPGCVAP